MICPVCNTHNTTHPQAEGCVQCGSDLDIHRLLNGVRERMKPDSTPSLTAHQKPSVFSVVFQTLPTLLLLVCTLFIVFVGIRFLGYLDKAESHHTMLTDKWYETGYEQLQQMNATIKQELDLILDQRRENQLLQSKLQQLTSTETSTTPTQHTPT